MSQSGAERRILKRKGRLLSYSPRQTIPCARESVPIHWKSPDAGRDWGQEEKGAGRRGWDGYVGTVHNFFSLVSPQQRFEMTGQCYNSVTVQNSIW